MKAIYKIFAVRFCPNFCFFLVFKICFLDLCLAIGGSFSQQRPLVTSSTFEDRFPQIQRAGLKGQCQDIFGLGPVWTGEKGFAKFFENHVSA